MTAPAGRLVVDASVAVKWLVDEPGTDAAHALADHDLAAPSLLRIEVANVIRTLVAGDAVTASAAADLFRLFQAVPLTIVDFDAALEERALGLALEIRHPVYDCVYLALAERMNRTLVTADARFLKAIHSLPWATRAVALNAWRTR